MGRMRVVAQVVSEPSRRRFVVGSGIHALSESSLLIGTLIAAHQIGGVAAMGLVGFLRVAPGALMAPFSSTIADRASRRQTLLVAYLLRALLLSLTATAVRSDTSFIGFASLIVAVGITSSVIRPAQWAFPPLLAKSPEEITPTMTGWTTLEGVGTIIGPAAAGLLIGAWGPETAILFSGIASAACGWLTAGLHVDERKIKKPFQISDLRSGLSTVAREQGPRLVIGLFTAQTFVRGLLNVLIVAAAIGVLGMGEGGAGYITAAMGVGGLIGGILTVSFVGKDDLGTRMAASLVMWGTPIAVIGLTPKAPVAALMLAFVGLGNAFLDVSGLSLLQRIAPPHALARVFGVLEGIVFLTASLGSLAAPPLIEWIGVRAAFVVIGCILPAAAALGYRSLRRLDAQTKAPEQRLYLLENIPLFAGLPPSDLATLAVRMDVRQVEAGETILTEGEPGDAFYVIQSGEVEVIRGGIRVAMLLDGDYFGEISLSRDVPRIASVVAVVGTELLVLSRSDFIGTVAGNPSGAAAVEAIVGQRLQRNDSSEGRAG